MLEASCHCGTVRITLAMPPEWLSACNCSLCRRLGTLWAYYHPSAVSFTKGAGSTVAYIQGDRSLHMHHCPTCGCTTHWSPAKGDGERMAINARLLDPEAIEGIRLRHFDGADSFTYLD